MTLCSFPDCGRSEFQDNLCPRHWQQRLAGTPLQPVRNHLTKAERERLHPQVLAMAADGMDPIRISTVLGLRLTTVTNWLRQPARQET